MWVLGGELSGNVSDGGRETTNNISVRKAMPVM